MFSSSEKALSVSPHLSLAKPSREVLPRSHRRLVITMAYSDWAIIAAHASGIKLRRNLERA